MLFRNFLLYIIFCFWGIVQLAAQCIAPLGYDVCYTVTRSDDPLPFDWNSSDPDNAAFAGTLQWAIRKANALPLGKSAYINFNLSAQEGNTIRISATIVDIQHKVWIDALPTQNVTITPYDKRDFSTGSDLMGIGIGGEGSILSGLTFKGAPGNSLFVGADNIVVSSCVFVDSDKIALRLSASNCKVQGCNFGTNNTATPIGIEPTLNGIMAEGQNNVIGGDTELLSNRFANFINGALVLYGTTGRPTDGNRIFRCYFENAGKNIELRTANINKSAPTITTYTRNSLSGYSNAENDEVEVFQSNGGGKDAMVWLGRAKATILKEGKWYWTLSEIWVREDQKYIATSTDLAGNTSEFSSPYFFQCVVTNINTTGEGSYKYVLQECAGANANLSTITFNIPGGGVKIIPVDDAWYTYHPIFLDGKSQPGYNPVTKKPMIVLEANGQVPWMFSLREPSEGTTIQGIHFKNFYDYGIVTLAKGLKVLDNVFTSKYPIAGNSNYYIILFSNAANSIIQGNIFGSELPEENAALGSGQYHVGVLVWSPAGDEHKFVTDKVTIGGLESGQANIFQNIELGVYLYQAPSKQPQQIREIYIRNNRFINMLDEKLYYTQLTNYNIAAPTITSAGEGIISGLANDEGSIVEVYTSNAKGDVLQPLGTTVANDFENGKWKWSVSSSQELGNYVIAIATVPGKGTGYFSDPFQVTCKNPEADYIQPLLSAVEPLPNSSIATIAGTILKWNFSKDYPTLEAGVTDYVLKVQILPKVTDTDGYAGPDYDKASSYTIPNNRATSVDLGNTALVMLGDKPQQVYWRVGLQYKATITNDGVTVQPVTWSQPQLLNISTIEQKVPSATALANSANNDINWNYEVTYLDNGKTAEQISYSDGLGQVRQVQSKINSESKILCVETAYSEEGGGSVTTMAAPTGASEFAYDKDFFEVACPTCSTGKTDFATEHFDRDQVIIVTDQITKIETKSTMPMPSVAVLSSDPGTVGYYYSNNNTAEAGVDNAQGLPYAYALSTKDPLGRTLSVGGVGNTFRATGNYATTYQYSTASEVEMAKIYGFEKAKTLENISKTIATDPNKIGSISYTDAEGKVIATALTSCAAKSGALEELVEDGMEYFENTYDVLKNNGLKLENAGQSASAGFTVPCNGTPVTLNYSSNLGRLLVGSQNCLDCKYDLSIAVTEDATGNVVYSNKIALPTVDKPCTDNTTTTYAPANVTLTLANAGSYTVQRSLQPAFDATSGVNYLDKAVQEFTQNLRDPNKKEINFTKFKAEYGAEEKWFLMRKAATSVYKKPDFSPYECLNVSTPYPNFKDELGQPLTLQDITSIAFNDNTGDMYFFDNATDKIYCTKKADGKTYYIAGGGNSLPMNFNDEPILAANLNLRNFSDMEADADGTLYVVGSGTVWSVKNEGNGYLARNVENNTFSNNNLVEGYLNQIIKDGGNLLCLSIYNSLPTSYTTSYYQYAIYLKDGIFNNDGNSFSIRQNGPYNLPIENIIASTKIGKDYYQLKKDSKILKGLYDLYLSVPLNSPKSLVSYNGLLYVLDGDNTIKIIDPETGDVKPYIGLSGSGVAVDGKIEVAKFGTPQALAINPNGQLFVSDKKDGFATIRKVEKKICDKITYDDPCKGKPATAVMEGLVPGNILNEVMGTWVGVCLSSSNGSNNLINIPMELSTPITSIQRGTVSLEQFRKIADAINSSPQNNIGLKVSNIDPLTGKPEFKLFFVTNPANLNLEYRLILATYTPDPERLNRNSPFQIYNYTACSSATKSITIPMGVSPALGCTEPKWYLDEVSLAPEATFKNSTKTGTLAAGLVRFNYQYNPGFTIANVANTASTPPSEDAASAKYVSKDTKLITLRDITAQTDKAFVQCFGVIVVPIPTPPANAKDKKNITYKFNITNYQGSGAKLFIDEQLVASNWMSNNTGVMSNEITLKPGQHTLQLNYFASSRGQTVSVEWKTNKEKVFKAIDPALLKHYPSQEQLRLADLDGKLNNSKFLGKINEQYNINNVTGAAAPFYNATNPVTDNSGRAKEVHETYARMYYKEIKDGYAPDISQLTLYSINPGDTKLLPVINDDKTLNTAEYTDDYYLVRAKVSSGSCASLCFEKDNTQSCADKCNEQLEAIKADIIGSKEDLDAHTYSYNISFQSSNDDGSDATITVSNVAQILERFKSNNQLPDELEEAIKTKENEADYKKKYPDISAIKLFDDYVSAITREQLFDGGHCIAVCSNPSLADCEMWQADFIQCRDGNLEDIQDGLNYLQKEWTGGNTTFPYIFTAPVGDVPGFVTLNKDQQIGLGTHLSKYFGAITTQSAYDAMVRAKEAWGSRTPNCPGCTLPAMTGTKDDGQPLNCPALPIPTSQANNSYVPVFLESTLEAANAPCIVDYNKHFLPVLTTKRQRYMKVLIDNCIAAGGNAEACSEAKLEISDRENQLMSAAGEYSTDPVLQRDYYNDLKVEYSKEKINIEDLQEALAFGLAKSACLADCKAQTDREYKMWVEDQILTFKKTIKEQFYANCYGKMNEVFKVTLRERYYHYTLYEYDPAGRLTSTIPPEGVAFTDFKAPIDDQQKVPLHRMPTTYQSNSLGELQSTTSPDAGLTRYLYDKAGRVRFSQNSEQKVRSTSSNCIFSYTKYDNETGRINETGECSQGTIAGSGIGFTEGDGDYNPMINTFVEAQNFPDKNFSTNTVLTDVNTYTYDKPLKTTLQQEYLAGRVAAVSNDNNSTHYSYDVHGRVKKVVQEQKTPIAMTKTIAYNYTPLTGQVEEVIYQATQADELHHHYSYDADNRLTKVEVSKNGTIKIPAAQYSYYTHGSLKNTLLGDNVQQTDYTYNLQGWLKSINHPIAANDPGKTNTTAGKDVFAEVLNYFDGDNINSFGDYNRAGMGLDALATVTPSKKSVIGKIGGNLYNGNIRGVVSYTAFDQVGQAVKPYLGIGYKYDQLNRLVNNETELLNVSAAGVINWNTQKSSGSPFWEKPNYDASGNIIAMRRTAEAASTRIDNLTYSYDQSGAGGKKINNKLLHVKDNASATQGAPNQGNYNPANPKQSTANYDYDAKGRMTQDWVEEIAKGGILWTTYDKVRSIVRSKLGTAAITKANLNYTYDAMGNRLAKAVDLPNTTTGDYTDNYVYDASGNVMAVYDKSGNLKEQYLYGVGRLGMYTPTASAGSTIQKENINFEVTDHLGSVRAIVKDIPRTPTSSNIVGLTDYLPFGMAMEGRKYSTPITYRYGFQGMEWDIETKTFNTLFRFYSPEYGRWWSPDPIVQPWQSDYSAMDGNPIYFSDPLGLKGGGGGGGGGGKSTTANDNTIYDGGAMGEVVVTAPKKTVAPKAAPTPTQAKGVPKTNSTAGMHPSQIAQGQARAKGRAEQQKQFDRIGRALEKFSESWYGSEPANTSTHQTGLSGFSMYNSGNTKGGDSPMNGLLRFGSMDLSGDFGKLDPGTGGISSNALPMAKTAEVIVQQIEKVKTIVDGGINTLDRSGLLEEDHIGYSSTHSKKGISSPGEPDTVITIRTVNGKVTNRDTLITR